MNRPEQDVPRGPLPTEGTDPDVDLSRSVDRGELHAGRAAVLLAVATGGALGALARYAVQVGWPTTPGGFPWAVLAVNVSGSVAIGVLLVVVLEILPTPHRLVRPFLGTGLLGGFTTMSTYADEVWLLARSGRAALAVGYATATLAGALFGVGVGVLLTRAAGGVRPVLGYRP